MLADVLQVVVLQFLDYTCMIFLSVCKIDPLVLQNFFHSWLVDNSTDSEHMHILLPTKEKVGKSEENAV